MKVNASLTNRQNQILDTSIEIIHSEGIQGFTMKNLSNAIGVTEAAIYRHFKSKNEILCAVLDNFINKLTNFIEKIKLTEDGALEKIKKIYQKLSNTFTNKPAYVSVIFAEEIFKNSKTLSEKVGKILDINNK
ncbi:MAG: TetR/AcrR family transcriptional regulator [Chlorobi bacterium]|nr:TetR/AcrR family transcriptional regulator [Chlorobiota bacterium]